MRGIPLIYRQPILSVQEMYEAELNVTFEILDEIKSEAKGMTDRDTILAMSLINYSFV